MKGLKFAALGRTPGGRRVASPALPSLNRLAGDAAVTSVALPSLKLPPIGHLLHGTHSKAQQARRLRARQVVRSVTKSGSHFRRQS